MFKYLRPKEQSYAFLRDVKHPEKNRYGTSIETVPEDSPLRGQSLNINGDTRVGDNPNRYKQHGFYLPEDSPLRGQSLNINGDTRVGDNPNRYKQHGFYFTADNCISCHACESACSEKNDLEPHQAFRAVGYVEGGSYPAYTRLNISMACNHCDDPVCLKGCPTRAYTKFAEYGAVLQDSDICFGCGYCTWVCPYNAPQLDHSKGHVSKCNMCVDRLEIGLKPACVSACLAGALDFGIMETTPENRDGLDTQIPGFPPTDITHPNIRFQQKNVLPDTMSRTDSMPIKYQKNAEGEFEATVAEKSVSGQKPEVEWNIKKLSTRENPLVIFTLITQAVVGAFALLFLGPMLGLETLTPEKNPLAWPMFLFGLIGIQTIALVLSTMHLGKPHRFYRAFNNLRYSPVSREVAGVAVFYNFIGAFTLLTGLPQLFGWLPEGVLQLFVTICGWGAVVSGFAAIYFMHKIYRIKARPFWNHWQVFTSFYGSMLSLGPLLLALVYGFVQLANGESWTQIAPVFAVFIFTGLLLEAVGLYAHQNDLVKKGGEGAAAHFEQTTKFGKTYSARNVGLLAGLILSAVMMSVQLDGLAAIVLWSGAAVIILLTAVTGRALFYALVMPTTMPGAFFWRNKKFQEHARETGLAKMPQVGVLPDLH